MNPFDAVVLLVFVLAVIMGFRAGLLRSVATIIGYVIAAPLAVAAVPYVAPVVNAQMKTAGAQDWVLLSVLLIVIGMILSALLRLTVNELSGGQVSALDRVAGAMLGAVRIVLVAVLIVLIFDRLIPPGREPAFLKGSHLRPLLSAAGREGLRSLPTDVAATIDRLKRERGL